MRNGDVLVPGDDAERTLWMTQDIKEDGQNGLQRIPANTVVSTSWGRKTRSRGCKKQQRAVDATNQ